MTGETIYLEKEEEEKYGDETEAATTQTTKVTMKGSKAFVGLFKNKKGCKQAGTEDLTLTEDDLN